ncbi:hypothetical protein [Streptomyces dysideae]|uniref:Uncharacterized protein n=1 Tax=Streptomyces dysideae TaxID=909626 RepID=A0A101V251_9ACTN|nr:hypothetical protein [Streptomyces dysideae]KUO21106.1 hypothetical protein AQJ91_10720 [Streptomyces dysideae]
MRMHRVGRSLAGLVAAAGLAGTAAFVVAGSPVGYFLFEYGCGSEEEKLGDVLAEESVLDAQPEEFGEPDPYQHCDDDDLFVVAGKSYSYGGSRDSVLAHYREAAPAKGWKPRSEDCFAKRIDGTTAFLMVEGPADGTVEIAITADRDDSGDWC